MLCSRSFFGQESHEIGSDCMILYKIHNVWIQSEYVLIQIKSCVLFLCCLPFHFLDPWRQPEGSYEQGLSVLPSFCPSFSPSFSLSFCPGMFLELCLQFFLNFGLVLETHEVVRDIAGFFRKKMFAPKLGKWTKNGPKTWFFEFTEKNCH